MSMSNRSSSLATSAERGWGRSSESLMVWTFQHATLRFAVFFFLSFFLPLGRDARWSRLANQVEVRHALFRPPFLGPSPCGASSAFSKEGCLVAHSAAECCCCLKSTDKRPIQLSRLHAELRLRLPVPSWRSVSYKQMRCVKKNEKRTPQLAQSKGSSIIIIKWHCVINRFFFFLFFLWSDETFRCKLTGH